MAWTLELYEPELDRPLMVVPWESFEELMAAIDIVTNMLISERHFRFTVPGYATEEEIEKLRCVGSINGDA